LLAARCHPSPEQQEVHYELMNALLHQIEELERELRPASECEMVISAAVSRYLRTYSRCEC
jgi:hypothetical protein